VKQAEVTGEKAVSAKTEYHRQYREKNREAIKKRQRDWWRRKREKTMLSAPKRRHGSIYYVDEENRVHFPNPSGYTLNEMLALLPQVAKEIGVRS